jgi:hypothetical protein
VLSLRIRPAQVVLVLLSSVTSVHAEVDSDSHPRPLLQLGAQLGMGELSLRFDGYGVWGRSHSVGVFAGVAPTRNLLLFATLYDAHAFEPSSSYRGLTDLNLLGVGPGLKYYLASTNLHFSMSLLLSRASFHNNIPGSYDVYLAARGRTDWGGTGRFAIGGEWRVSPRWWLGLDGEILLGYMGLNLAGRDTTSRITGISAAVSASHRFPAGPEPLDAADTRGYLARQSGLYLDARLGVGKLWGDFEWPASGRSLPYTLAAGWGPRRDVVFFVEMAAVHMFSPEVPDFVRLHSADLYSVGPGLKHYVTSMRFFVAGSISMAWLRYHADAADTDAFRTHHRGFAARLSLGKEWGVSAHWGIGLAVEGMVGRMWTEEVSQYTTKGLALLTTASYNLASNDEADGPPSTTSAPAHRGLYVGARLGVGWLGANHADSGWGTPYALSLGYTVAPNLVLMGELFDMKLRQTIISKVDQELLVLGPGLTYYLMPTNTFASASLGLSQLSCRSGIPADTRYGGCLQSEWGFTGRISLGKEWWVSSSVGIGIGGEAFLGQMAERSYSEPISHTVGGFSLFTSASFN